MLLNSWEFDQLVKIPALIQHYTEHLSQDESISFVGFLKMHYQSENAGHDSNDKHNHLPFKSHECQNMNQILVLEIFQPALKQITPVLLNTNNDFYQNSYVSENVGSIWQPPQIA